MAVKQFTERAQLLLRELVELYIKEGTPIGSKTLAESMSYGLSAATIRNVMADLEGRGYLTSPHTSAGRVPTQQGYRLFVDQLLAKPEGCEFTFPELLNTLNAEKRSPNEMVEGVSDLLAQMTQMVSLVKLPSQAVSSLRHVEFLPLSDNRILAILVFNESDVKNRIIHTDRPYSESELAQASNFINHHYVGKQLVDMREQLLKSLQEDKDRLDEMMQLAVDLAAKAIDDQAEAEESCVVKGEVNLLSMAEQGSAERLTDLFDAFNQKRDVLHLLDECVRSRDVQIFIGDESGMQAFGDCSVISAPYELDGEVLGVLAVVGPTRMDYKKIIPMVGSSAKMLSQLLKKVD